MSRNYRLLVQTKLNEPTTETTIKDMVDKIDKRYTLQEIMVKIFGWVEDYYCQNEDTFEFEGEGSLYGGKTEEEAHNEIYKKIKEFYPEAEIRTHWTYLDNLPQNTYGDEI